MGIDPLADWVLTQGLKLEAAVMNLQRMRVLLCVVAVHSDDIRPPLHVDECLTYLTVLR